MPLDDRLRSVGQVLTRLSVEHDHMRASRRPNTVSSSRPLLWLAVAVATMVVAVILTLVIPHRRSEPGPATTPARVVATASSAAPTSSVSG